MKSIRTLTLIFSILAAAMFAQSGQAPNGNAGTAKDVSPQADHGLPAVDQQLKILSEKLGLSSDQQARVKPILRELHEATRKLIQDDKLSREERLEKVRPLRHEADRKIRELLNDEQKQKLDQYEQGPHSEMHGDLHGGKQPPK